MTILKAKPDIGVPGTAYRLPGSGLPAAARTVSIVWNTANVTWVVDPRPDSVDYLGRKAEKVDRRHRDDQDRRERRVLAQLKAPRDFGGIHDIYAVIDGVQVAKEGFLISRWARMTPKKRPDRAR